jgi:hypothetical protein
MKQSKGEKVYCQKLGYIRSYMRGSEMKITSLSLLKIIAKCLILPISVINISSAWVFVFSTKIWQTAPILHKRFHKSNIERENFAFPYFAV